VNHIILDTHLLLWAAAADSRLPKTVIHRLNDRRTEPLFSGASIREVVIKAGPGRTDFKVDPSVLRRGLVDNGHKELPIALSQPVPAR